MIRSDATLSLNIIRMEWVMTTEYCCLTHPIYVYFYYFRFKIVYDQSHQACFYKVTLIGYREMKTYTCVLQHGCNSSKKLLKFFKGKVVIRILRKSSTVLSTPSRIRLKLVIRSQRPLNNSYGFGPTK